MNNNTNKKRCPNCGSYNLKRLYGKDGANLIYELGEATQEVKDEVDMREINGATFDDDAEYVCLDCGCSIK